MIDSNSIVTPLVGARQIDARLNQVSTIRSVVVPCAKSPVQNKVFWSHSCVASVIWSLEFEHNFGLNPPPLPLTCFTIFRKRTRTQQKVCPPCLERNEIPVLLSFVRSASGLHVRKSKQNCCWPQTLSYLLHFLFGGWGLSCRPWVR